MVGPDAAIHVLAASCHHLIPSGVERRMCNSFYYFPRRLPLANPSLVMVVRRVLSLAVQEISISAVSSCTYAKFGGTMSGHTGPRGQTLNSVERGGSIRLMVSAVSHSTGKGENIQTTSDTHKAGMGRHLTDLCLGLQRRQVHRSSTQKVHTF